MSTINMDTSMPALRQGTQLAQRDLAVHGRFDAAAGIDLRALVTQAVQDGPALVLLDVTRVTEVTPSGLAGALELLRLVRSRGGDLRMYGSSMAVINAQHVARLTEISRVYGGRQAAVEAGRRRPTRHVRLRKRRSSVHERAAKLQVRLAADARRGILFPAFDGIVAGPPAVAPPKEVIFIFDGGSKR
ncbi:MAG: STAS domain-containing protein [Candidatus Nanopelagicales bacterium]